MIINQFIYSYFVNYYLYGHIVGIFHMIMLREEVLAVNLFSISCNTDWMWHEDGRWEKFDERRCGVQTQFGVGG